MTKANAARPGEIAGQLSPPQRVLLFCVASDTDWRRFGIQKPTVQLTVLQRLLEWRLENLALTDRGEAVLDELIAPKKKR
jgi:hypothetical protein